MGTLEPSVPFAFTCEGNLPEVGASGTEEIRQIRHRVIGGRNPAGGKWVLRYAPSLIARSEAELFGVSLPRFALRVYLDNDSFVNVRRIATFSDQARRWGKRYCPKHRQLQHIEPMKWQLRGPGWDIRKNTCIGDSVLVHRGKRDDFMLTSELGRAYGEGRDIRGTPYVKHIPLAGGGLCAQAVCFMATALLHRFAVGVYGVAEITALVTQDDSDEFRLSGLSPDQMVSYFRNPLVGLNAIHQQAMCVDYRQREQMFQNALRTYILSKMPIILMVDFGRMAGLHHPDFDCFLKINGHEDPAWMVVDWPSVRPRNHVMLVVGCHQEDDRFYLNDPGSSPFLHGNTRELVDIAQYNLPADGSFDPNTLYNSDLVRCQFIAVTPRDVKMPLQEWFLPGSNRHRLLPGLLQLIHALQGFSAMRNSHGLPKPGLSNIRLVQAAEAAEFDQVPQEAKQVLARELNTLCKPQHWCWLQCNADSVWVWDAQKEPALDGTKPSADTYEAILGYVMSLLMKTKAGWIPVRRVPAHSSIDKQTEDDRHSPPAPRIGISLISSFAAGHGLDTALQHWPGKANCELYALMQQDAVMLGFAPSLGLKWLQQFFGHSVLILLSNAFRRLGLRWYFKRGLRRNPRPSLPIGFRWPITSVTDRMAVRHRDERFIKSLAAALSEKFIKKGIHLCALASFIPEITTTGPKGGRARHSLEFLIRLAGHLRKDGHPLKTIEIVAGTLVDGIWHGRSLIEKDPKEAEAYIANRMSEVLARHNLQAALVSLAAEIQNAEVQIALELEPGPLYLLRDWKTLVAMSDMLDADPILSPLVGLNLDIAHWTLAGLSGIMLGGSEPTESAFEKQERSEFESQVERIRRRVVHAHISDHGRGHFGDVRVCDITEDHKFGRWLKLLQEIADTPRDVGHPSFDRMLSIELEAVKRPKMVAESLEILSKIKGGL